MSQHPLEMRGRGPMSAAFKINEKLGRNQRERPMGVSRTMHNHSAWHVWWSTPLLYKEESAKAFNVQAI